MEAGFFVEVLALETDVVLGFLEAGVCCVAPGFVVAVPDNFALAVCQFLRGAEVVGVVVVDLIIYRAAGAGLDLDSRN